jgi:hypothetical protein
MSLGAFFFLMPLSWHLHKIISTNDLRKSHDFGTACAFLPRRKAGRESRPEANTSLEKESVMRRVVLTLSVAAAIALLFGAGNEAKAMTASQAMAIQAAEQAVAQPGHFGHHWGHHHPPFGPVVYGPYCPPPVVVYGPQYYPPYYGYPVPVGGGIVVGGRGWRVGIGF